MKKKKTEKTRKKKKTKDGEDRMVLQSSISLLRQDMFHERAWIRSDIFAVAIKCVVETRDANHSRELQNKLHEVYGNIVWGVREVKAGEHSASSLDFNACRCDSDVSGRIGY